MGGDQTQDVEVGGIEEILVLHGDFPCSLKIVAINILKHPWNVKSDFGSALKELVV